MQPIETLHGSLSLCRLAFNYEATSTRIDIDVLVIRLSRSLTLLLIPSPRFFFLSLPSGASSIPYLPVNRAGTGIHPSGSGFENIIHSKAAPGVEDGLYPRGFQSRTITTCREAGPRKTMKIRIRPASVSR